MAGTRSMLHDLVALSHEFGGDRYVRGGGGNSSAKNAATLWIKPSGTAMADLRAEQFVVIDRHKLQAYFAYRPSDDWRRRESDLKEITAAAIAAGSTGRPSVETALHDSLPHAFCLHTHPTLVNALTCGANGRARAAEMFSDALWVPTAGPGYALCVATRAEADAYRRRHFREPGVILMQHQGLFVAGDTPDEVRARAHGVVDAVAAAVRRAGIPEELAVGPDPDTETVGVLFDRLQDVVGEDASTIIPSGPFRVAEGAISPDHIVYSRARLFMGDPTPEALEAFRERYGYWPRVLATPTGVYGLGRTHKAATLALEFARDGALVAQYAAAFGGVTYLSDDLIDYVEQWEVECYRRKGAGA